LIDDKNTNAHHQLGTSFYKRIYAKRIEVVSIRIKEAMAKDTKPMR
jgi:hypothetical protein